MKKIITTLVLVAMTLVVLPVYAAENNVNSSMPAYSEVFVNGSSLGTVNFDSTYQHKYALYNDAIRASIETVLEMQKSGAVIVWDENYLNNIIQVQYPELYLEIKSAQNNIYEVPLESLGHNPQQRGELTDTFEYVTTSFGPFHTNLFTLRSTIRWMWDGADYIYGVYPQSRVLVHDPLWTLYDPAINDSHWNATEKVYYVEGHLYCGIDTSGTPIGLHNYPYMEIKLEAGNGYIIYTGNK